LIKLFLKVKIILKVLMCFGVKESALLNKIFTALNLTILAVIFFAGISKAKLAYWKIEPSVIATG
jgi:amino acid transporter